MNTEQTGENIFTYTVSFQKNSSSNEQPTTLGKL